MKKILVYFLSLLLCLSAPAQLRADEDSMYQEMTGLSASDSSNAGIGISMMGWGVAIIVGITILALVLHQSTGSGHNDSSSN